MNIQEFLHKLIQKEHLSKKEAEVLLGLLTREDASPVQIGAVLTALRSKGEVTEEIVGFITGMREKMSAIAAPKDAIDVCGTGGDRSGTINVSTTASFVIAACGVPVVKHGNRSASSLCGSADVLEALGVHIMLTPKQAETVLQKTGMVFLFAPAFHPAFKQVGAVRKALGVPTIFNFLGPLSNPAHVTRQIIGVPTISVAQQLAKVATQLDYKHLFIVASEDGLDEVSLGAKTQVFEVKGKKLREFSIDPGQYGFTNTSKDSLRGGNATLNAAITKNILAGEKSVYRDVVVLNSAVGLYVAGKVKTITAGVVLAAKAIDSGRAKQMLEKLVKETQHYA
jgi:anthranilate phosphoribosyltransferase